MINYPPCISIHEPNSNQPLALSDGRLALTGSYDVFTLQLRAVSASFPGFLLGLAAKESWETSGG